MVNTVSNKIDPVSNSSQKRGSVLAFRGDEEDVNFAFKFFCDKGFYPLDLNDKVKEVAKSVLNVDAESLTDENIQGIRQGGEAISPTYWLNMSLCSVKEKATEIIIKELKEGRYPSHICVYKIYNIDKYKTVPPQNSRTIYYKGDRGDLETSLYNILQKLRKTL